MNPSLNQIDVDRIKFGEHHRSHAAATFFTSPFDSALVIVSDAVGEWDSQSIWVGKDNSLNKIASQSFPHSIGLFYSAMTYYLGFKVNSGEYKLMGLAPYGKPRYVGKIKEIINLSNDGAVRLDLSKFSFVSGNSMTDGRFEKFFGKSRRMNSAPLTQWHADMAASVQLILEEALENLIDFHLSESEGLKKICLGGGVALNCVANSRIAEKYGPENLFIFPAAGDSGASVGAGLSYLGNRYETNKTSPSKRWKFNNSLLGVEPEETRCLSELRKLNLNYKTFDGGRELANVIAVEISKGSIVGIFNGKEEFGPRALGNRSILADPRIQKGQITLNEKIKFRESFRPFAPIVLEEQANNWFDIQYPEPFMLKTVSVRNFRNSFNLLGPESNEYLSPIDIESRLNKLDSLIPSVTHLDGSSRIQTIAKSDTRLVRKILEQFYEVTGCPILVNTSFNVRGEPIVHSVKDALRCFLTTEIDVLVLMNFVIFKKEQKIDTLKHTFESATSDD